MFANQFKTFFLMVCMIALITAFGALLDNYYGSNGTIFMVFFGISLLTTWGSYWFSDTIVQKIYKAREVSAQEEPVLHEIVARLSVNAGIPMPRIAIVPMQEPNAFATGRNHSRGLVACTEGILSMLDKRELEGVLAHEIAHIKHYDTLLQTVAATLAGVIGMLASMSRWGMMFGGGRNRENNNPLALVLIIVASIVAPLIAMLIQMGISRSREFMADASGAKYSGKPDALASALLKMQNYVMATKERGVKSTAVEGTEALFIVNPFSGGGVMELFSTHPSTEKRVARLREMQDSKSYLS